MENKQRQRCLGFSKLRRRSMGYRKQRQPSLMDSFPNVSSVYLVAGEFEERVEFNANGAFGFYFIGSEIWRHCTASAEPCECGFIQRQRCIVTGEELDWIGLDWTGLDWTGLDWIIVSGAYWWSLSATERSRAEQSRAGQSGAEQSRGFAYQFFTRQNVWNFHFSKFYINST